MPEHEALDVKISMRIDNYVVSKLQGTWIHDVFNKLRSLKQRVTRRSDGDACCCNNMLAGLENI